MRLGIAMIFGGPVRHVARRMRAAALDVGILPYRPASRSVTEWERTYASSGLDYLAGVPELARYSIIVGYLAWLGDRLAVLDVGCGEGLLRERMAGISFRKYVGVDVAPFVIERARRLEDDRTHFGVGGPAQVSSTSFDVVVLNEVMSVTQNPEELLLTSVARLRDGGHVLTSNWRHPGDRALWRLLDRHLEPVDVVELYNGANRWAPRGVRVACHRSLNPSAERA